MGASSPHLPTTPWGSRVSPVTRRQGALTVSLNVDYVANARLGQWLRIEPRVIKVGGTLGFADALITADQDINARASATFRMFS